MWIGSIMLRVSTKNAQDAGTDSLVTAMIVREGNDVVNLALDYPTEDDLERGAQRDYIYFQLPRHNDQTPELPPGIGQNPMPYPDFGVEYSNKLPGHLKLRVRIHNDDMWIKDNIDLFIREVRRVATSFDAEAWEEEGDWTYIATWSKDIAMSTDADEGFTNLNLVLN